MSGSGCTTTKPAYSSKREKAESASSALRINCRMCGCCFKTQFDNSTSGWIRSENVFVAPTRKGETLPKWADLQKNEKFVVPKEVESFSTRVFSSCGTKVRNCPGKLHGDAFAN